MRRTKVICTLGPTTSSYKILRGLVKAGMNIARLNFSHGTHREHLARIKLIRRIQKEQGKFIPILADISGPKIRVGILKKDIMLKEGEMVTLSCRDSIGEGKCIPSSRNFNKLKFQQPLTLRGKRLDQIGTTPGRPSPLDKRGCPEEDSARAEREPIWISYRNLYRKVSKGCSILLDDGTIKLKVKKVEGKEIKCRVGEGGVLESRKSINVPGVSLGIRLPTEKDKEDLKFAQTHGVDFIGVSFVKRREDLITIRKLLRKSGSEVPLIAKIELPEAVRNIDGIIKEADGVMIARGDLGVEMPTEEIPLIQKEIVKKCQEYAKPVIIATQMLESMVENVLPTRAEASDVANAIFDGSDILMLSAETSIGKNPVRALSTMVRIILKTEGAIDYRKQMKMHMMGEVSTIARAISQAACESASSLKASAIIIPTYSGSTARLVSSRRPSTPIYAVTHNRRLLPYLELLWGIRPFFIPKAKTTDQMIEFAINAVKKGGEIKKGNIVVITAGIPLNVPGTTNLIKIEQI